MALEIPKHEFITGLEKWSALPGGITGAYLGLQYVKASAIPYQHFEEQLQYTRGVIDGLKDSETLLGNSSPITKKAIDFNIQSQNSNLILQLDGEPFGMTFGQALFTETSAVGLFAAAAVGLVAAGRYGRHLVRKRGLEKFHKEASASIQAIPLTEEPEI